MTGVQKLIKQARTVRRIADLGGRSREWQKMARELSNLSWKGGIGVSRLHLLSDAQLACASAHGDWSNSAGAIGAD